MLRYLGSRALRATSAICSRYSIVLGGTSGRVFSSSTAPSRDSARSSFGASADTKPVITLSPILKAWNSASSSSANFSSSMVGSLLKASVGRFPDSKGLGPTTPIRIDPTSMHQSKPGLVERIQQIVVGKVRLQFKPPKHRAQQLVADLDAIRHGLADGFGLSEQGFGFRGFHFHSSTVGRWAVN